MDIKQELAIKIKAYRLAKRMSQEDLAFKANIDRTYMSDIERGNRNFSIEILQKIADALEIEIKELF